MHYHAYMTAATLGKVYRQGNKTLYTTPALVVDALSDTLMNGTQQYTLLHSAPSVFPAESSVTLKTKFKIHTPRELLANSSCFSNATLIALRC